MATVSIPQPTTVAVGQRAASADFNTHATAINFWAQPPAARVYRYQDTGNLAVGMNVVPFNAESFDNVPSGASPMHDISTNPERLTVPVAGVYAVGYSVMVDATTAAQQCAAYLYKNGSEYGCEVRQWNSSNERYLTFAGADLVQCAAGDYLDVRVNFSTYQGLVVGSTGASSFWAILQSQ